MAYSLDTAGLSLYAIPALWFTVQWPHAQKTVAARKALNIHRGDLNCDPRMAVDWCQQKEVPQPVVERLRRMQSAHINGVESFPFWMGTIVAANAFGVDAKTTNAVAAYLIGARCVYNYLYIYNDGKSRGMARSRSLTWLSTNIACFYLLVKAANILIGKSVMM
ncbi:hypothetical protein M407DRAFT_152436 [Tulasnella calospora MUT 4182]|uniref:Uncharacterized protein n=1 Tax=Tulasnella calospora MUT 4182 TaxID=1051891 RepID=A0A0C3PVV0_9AGAM|nr:hypothetical protein M407DRAFT_152436 [Tulasnella calospora MUT 4182]